MGQAAALLLALVFTAVVGANDGGALLSCGLKFPGFRLRGQVALLVGAVAVVPLLFGWAVAQTFCHRLAAGGPHGRAADLLGLAVAVAVSATLASRGRPTSLTLAVTGGLAGAGLGLGLPVHLGALLTVLGVAAAAPFAGALVAWALRRLLTSLAWSPAAQPLAFVLLAVAYALNDGQKMLAAFAIAGWSYGPGMTLLVAAVFGVGLLVGLPKVARSFGESLVPVKPPTALSAEVAASAAVLASAALGMPVSMTQSLSGGLVGAELGRGGRSIRWNSVLRILWAWALTLPASVALSAAGAALLRLL